MKISLTHGLKLFIYMYPRVSVESICASKASVLGWIIVFNLIESRQFHGNQVISYK